MADVSDIPVKKIDLFERFLQANQVAIFVAVCVLAYYMAETNSSLTEMRIEQEKHVELEGHPGMMERQVEQESLLLQISEQIETTNNRFSAFALDYEIGTLISERRDIRLELLVLKPDDTNRARYETEIRDIEGQLQAAREARARYLIESTNGNQAFRD